MKASGFDLYRSGMAWAPRKVATISSRAVCRHLADDSQHLQFIFRIQPVTAFYLQGSGAKSERPLHMTESIGIEFLGHWPLPRPCTEERIPPPCLSISRYGVPAIRRAKFLFAECGKTHMGVGINETGNHASAAAINLLPVHLCPLPQPAPLPHRRCRQSDHLRQAGLLSENAPVHPGPSPPVATPSSTGLNIVALRKSCLDILRLPLIVYFSRSANRPATASASRFSSV